MKTQKLPIIVESFHFDMVDPKTKPSQDVQVAMRQVEMTDPKVHEEEKKGNFFQMMVPFSISPEGSGFQISGKITRIIQVLDYFGQANDIEPDELQKLSRPLVEYIETLTYQVTAVALDQGVKLDFQPNPGK